MGKTHDALVRAERERQARLARGADEAMRGAAAAGRPSLLQRWRHPQRRLEPPGSSERAKLAAVLEQVDALGLQLDAFEETVAKKVPELEGRLLHLLESRLERLEAQLQLAVRAAVAAALPPQRLEGRVAALLGVVLILLVALWLK